MFSAIARVARRWLSILSYDEKGMQTATAEAPDIPPRRDPRFKPVSTRGEIVKVFNNPEFLRIGGRYPVNDVSYLAAMP